MKVVHPMKEADNYLLFNIQLINRVRGLDATADDATMGRNATFER